MAGSVGIGLDIDEDQIRAVKLQHTRDGIHLQRLGAIPTPDGAVAGGKVRDVQLLADGVRRVFADHGISGSGVVVGLSGRGTVSRSLDLPAMREEEMRTVLAGELEHYRMVPTGQGAFDALPLANPPEEQDKTRLLLIAAEKNTVDSYRKALRLAARQMTALEPVLAASCRGAYSTISKGNVAFVVLGARSTELAIFCDGALTYSRHIDTGSLDLAQDGFSADLDLTPPSEMERGQPPSEPQLSRLAGPDRDATPLVYELQRSLEFYHRETDASCRADRILLCADVERLPGLDSYLEQNLGLPLSLCQPFEGMIYRDSQFDANHLARVGPAFAPAVGLALHAIGQVPELPYLDLSETGPETRLARVAPGLLRVSLVASAVLIIAALVASFATARVLDARKGLLLAAKDELQRILQIEQQRTSEARRAQEALTLVELRGLPWSDILFQTSDSMPQGVWLTSLRADSANLLSLEGMALSPEAVATLMESLTRSPLFERPRMTRLQKRPRGEHSLVTYEMKVSVTHPSDTAQPPADAFPPEGAAQ